MIKITKNVFLVSLVVFLGCSVFTFVHHTISKENANQQVITDSSSSHHSITQKNIHISKSLHVRDESEATFILNYDLPNRLAFATTIIFQDHKGDLWAGTEGKGIFEQEKGAQKFVNQDVVSFPSDPIVTAIFEDISHNLWVAISNHGLWELNLNKEVDNFTLRFPFDKDEENIGNIFQDHSKNLWLVVGGGATSGIQQQLYEEKWKDTKFNLIQTFPNPMKAPPKFEIPIFQDSSFNLWFGSKNDGLWEKPFQKDTIVHINEKSWLSSGVAQIYQDSEKQLWIGTTTKGLWKGMLNKQTKKIDFVQINTGIPTNANITKFFIDKSDDLWIGTNKQGLWEQEKGQKQFVQKSFSTNGMGVTQICQGESDNNLWIGTVKTGLWVEQLGSDKYRKIKEIPNDKVLVFFQDRNENLWVSVTHGVYERLADGIEVSPDSKTKYIRNIQSYDFVCQDSFHVNFVASDIKSFQVNKDKEELVPKSRKIEFEKTKYDNQQIKLTVNFNDEKPSYTKQYLIKSEYLDNGDGSMDKLGNALKNVGGEGETNSDVFLLGDKTQKKYQLFCNLARDTTSTTAEPLEPILTIDSTKLNFLTDYTNSTYEHIKIENGKIIKTNPTPLSSIKTTILGTAKDNIYEVDLVDYLGNQKHFLVQEGGEIRNRNFLKQEVPFWPINPSKPILTKKMTWKYVALGIGAGLVLTLLLLGLVMVFGAHNRLLHKKTITAILKKLNTAEKKNTSINDK